MYNFINNSKRIIATIIIMLMVIAVTSIPNIILPVWGAEQRVFDDAGLFTNQEKTTLEDHVADAIKTTHMDVVVVTTDNAGGKSAMEYADDYFDQGGFGTGTKKSGILYLIDMDNRELYISTKGDTIRLITDSRVESMLDDAYGFVTNENYSDSVISVVDNIEEYFKTGYESGQYNYDSETGAISYRKTLRWYEVLIAIAVATTVALSYCLSIKKQYAMKSEKRQASGYNLAYRALASFAFVAVADQLLDKHVSQRIIPRNMGGPGGTGSSGGGFSGRSTTHSSGGGSTHGGGGRSF